jgi:RND family efflux transporter MFP subunit
MNKRLKLSVGFIVVVAALAWLAVQWLRPEAHVAAARRETAVNAVPGSVTVLAERALQVRSEVGGRVVASKLDLSSKVAEGGVLVELDKGEVDLQIEQLVNDRDATKRRIAIGSATQFELLNAKDQLATAERQFKLGAITALEQETQRRAVKQLEQRMELENVTDTQTLNRIETDLKSARRRHDLMTIRSPADGVVSAVFVNVGDIIGGNQPVATVIADSRIVEAKISEENFSGLKVGQAATVRFLSYGANQYNGRVEKILPAADPLTQRYMVHLSVEIDPKLLVPGITGEVNIVIGSRPNAVVIPRRALLGRSLFVVKEGRVELRTVQIGFSSLDVVEITSGLTEGEMVIVDELDSFRAGDRVSVVQSR